jgi:hypothetical protein
MEVKVLRVLTMVKAMGTLSLPREAKTRANQLQLRAEVSELQAAVVVVLVLAVAVAVLVVAEAVKVLQTRPLRRHPGSRSTTTVRLSTCSGQSS